jgi:TonB family protein
MNHRHITLRLRLALLLFACGSVFLAQGLPGSDSPQRVAPGVAEANLLTRIDPIYPALSRAARVEATVILDVTIDKEGKVTNLKMVSGHPLLNETAMEAVRQWRYSPHLRNGQPADAITSVTLDFRLTPQVLPSSTGEIRGRIRHVGGEPAVVGSQEAEERLVRSNAGFVVHVAGGTSPRTLSGQVVVLDNMNQPSPGGSIEIGTALLEGATSNDRVNPAISAQVDGSFKLPMDPGKWLVFFPQLHFTGYSVRSVSYGTSNALTEPLELTEAASAGEIRITLQRAESNAR